MHATATKANAPAAAGASDAATASKAGNAVTGSPQQIPLWAERAGPAPVLASGRAVRFSLGATDPGDKYEQEADRVAAQITQLPLAHMQRKACACGRQAGADGMCDECRRKQRLQRQASREAPGNDIDARPQIQTDLKIGDVDDRYEREADQVAARIMRMAQPAVQRKCARCEQEEPDVSPTLALKARPMGETAARTGRATPNAATETAAPEKTAAEPIQLTPAALSSGGQPLPPALQKYYEDRFRYDFSRVRVHTGKSAAEKADALQAYAFTFGSHIYLGSGQSLSPSTLLAHELTHVIQQTSPPAKTAKTGSTAEAAGGANAPPAQIQQDTGHQPLVQGAYYWVPLEATTKGSGTKGAGAMTGTQIEAKLKQPLSGWAMSTQVDIPNGNRAGTGLDFLGRADLYTGTPIGIRFVSPDNGTCNGQPLGRVTDWKTSKDKMNGKKGRPNLAGGNIADVASAPTAITLGEIKPATKDLIKFGQQQVDNYKKGIEFAREQTNCTLTQTGSTEPQWPQITLDNIQQSTHPLPAALQFTPGVTIPGNTFTLGIGTFLGTSGVGMTGKGSAADDVGVRITFNPITDLNPSTPIEGDMYAMIDNKGVLAYFFRPNLDQAAIDTLITDRHKYFSQRQGAQTSTAYATQVQDEIVTALTTPPYIVTFSWHHRPLHGGPQPRPLAAAWAAA